MSGPRCDERDFTGRVGELAMYSYDRPSYMVWDAVMKGLMDQGYSQTAAEAWLKSKAARWALDGAFGDILCDAAYKFGKSEAAANLASKSDCKAWARD